MSRTSVIQLRQSGSIFMPAFSQFLWQDSGIFGHV